MALVIDACAAQHQGDRKEQQDRIAILPHPKKPGVVLAVLADGMGGHTGGALAAEQVVHTVRNNFERFSPSEETPESLISTSAHEAHTMIKASHFINEKDPHSTAVLLLLQPGKATWGHCGDSRLYRFNDGRLLHRTVDHSYVEHMIALGRLTPAQALRHPHRNVLIASLGGQDDPEVAVVGAADLAGGDAFVLCSDGLWNYFDEQEIGEIVSGYPARRACEMLIEEARARALGAGDNISVAIIKLVEKVVEKPDPLAGRGPRPLR